MNAQAALRRYVGYRELLAEAKQHEPGANQRQARLDAYGAIHRTPYAGTCVYEIVVDDSTPVRRRARRRSS
jgi:hypothetical protein